MKFGTKAETLDKLYTLLKCAKVLPQVRFDVEAWESDELSIMKIFRENEWIDGSLIVRSSAIVEDSSTQSMAGHYLSVLNVRGEEELKEAIEEVIASFKEYNPKDQVFVQPMLENVVCSGVAFSKDPNTGADYIVVNYDDSTSSTSSVTSGSSNDLNVFYYYKKSPFAAEGKMNKVIELVNELEEILNNGKLDIEFAMTEEQNIFLLQVRPLCMKVLCENKEKHYSVLNNIHEKINRINCRHPYLYGNRTVFGVMPDWNPAEIIGIRPNPLSMSLYKEVVTDNIWAYQRHNYGYKNLRSFPLMLDFYGLPYIDVRVSFNSFLPADLEDDLCEKLINYYIDRLVEKPSNHDKVEFEIIYSCYTLDLPERIFELEKYGFTDQDCEKILESLRELTNSVIHGELGLWKKDIEKIKILEERRQVILDSSLDKISKIYWLLEDCKRYGTLPFAGLARAGFIAVQMLKSLVNIGVLSSGDYEKFMSELDTVSSKMSVDFQELSKIEFLKKYGHLRPGTYDILSPRYDEEPDKYFDWNSKQSDINKVEKFHLSLQQLNRIKELLKEHNLVQDVLGLFDFIKIGIEGREYSKFVFTKSLSDAIQLFKELGVENGFTIEECSFVDASIIKNLYASSVDVNEEFSKSIETGKRKYEITKELVMPPLIIDSKDVWFFNQPSLEPNFITLKKVTSKITFPDEGLGKIKNSILFIPSADPGYDWVFSHDIEGFVTMYGGINSHMAIRAGELGIPAIIGAGEMFFNKWKTAETLEIDCANRRVRVIK